MIVPPKQIGSVRIGMSHVAVEQRIGAGRPRPTTPGKVLTVRYPRVGLEAVYARAGDSAARPVIAILTRDPRYHTSSGVRVGSTLGTVARLTGVHCFDREQTCQQGFRRHGRPGVVYTLRNGKVVRIAAYAFAD